MKTALVLGGGGARGLAHLGVLQVLEQERIVPDLIVGCSIGAVIGAMYAQTPDAKHVQNRVAEFFQSKVYQDLNIDFLEKHRNGREGKDFIHQIARNALRRVMLNMVASRTSIIRDEKISAVIEFLVDEGKIEDTHIQFACNATNLADGQPVLFTEGDIRFAVKASSTIPGYLPPVQNDSQLLVDGAVTYSLPVKYARMLGADAVIAVDVKQDLNPQTQFRNVFDVILRANSVTSARLAEEIAHCAEVTIAPKVGQFMWYEFRAMQQLVAAGEEAAYLHLDEIRKQLRRAQGGFLRRLFRGRKTC